MKAAIGFSIILIVCVIAAFFAGSTSKENQMEKKEVRNILLMQNQMVSSILNSIEKETPHEYIKAQIITLQYSGMHFNEPSSSIIGFIDHCLADLDQLDINRLRNTITEAVSITEKMRLESTSTEIKTILKEYNDFITGFQYSSS